MVQKVTPTVYLYNSTHNLYAVLVQRTGSAGVKYFFVSANASAGILPPPYAHRYGSEWDTAAQAQSNIPSGFTVVPAPESCNMSIAVAVAIFEGINISVFGSPAGATSWTLQVSTNGTTFTTAKTVSSLLPNNSTGSGGNPTADGEIYYQVATSGLYYFRVLSSPCTSNTISQNLTVFSDARPTCGRGPTLYNQDGIPSIINITSNSLTFRFDGEGLTSIRWNISSNNIILRSGIVPTLSNNVPITFAPLANGTYQLSIEGDNCSSTPSTSLFIISTQQIQKELIISPLSFDTAARNIQVIDEYIALGFNQVHISNQPIDYFFSNYTDFLNNVPHQNQQNDPAYSTLAWEDWLLPILTHMKNNHPTIPVFLRIQVSMSVWPNLQNLPQYAGKTPWWEVSESVTNEWGYLSNNDGGGIRRNPSFASNTAKTRIAQFINWLIPKVKAALNPNQLKYYSYVTSGTYEFGFTQNTPAFDPYTAEQLAVNYFFHGDYSQPAIASYRQYLLDKYGSISAINSAHGTTFASINDVTPPISNQTAPGLIASDKLSGYYNTYQGIRGQDWGQSRIKDLFTFLEALPKISGCEQIIEVGHLAYTFSHITFGGAPRLFRDRIGKIKVAQEAADIMKNEDIHSDFFTSHLNQEVMGELAIFDARKTVVNGFGTSVTQVTDAFINRYIQAGASKLMLITSLVDINYQEFKNYWTPEKVANFYNTAAFIPDTSSWPQISVNYQEWSTQKDVLFNRWKASGGSNTQRVKINYTEPSITGI